jgi:hypothetical protein
MLLFPALFFPIRIVIGVRGIGWLSLNALKFSSLMLLMNASVLDFARRLTMGIFLSVEPI